MPVSQALRDKLAAATQHVLERDAAAAKPATSAPAQPPPASNTAPASAFNSSRLAELVAQNNANQQAASTNSMVNAYKNALASSPAPAAVNGSVNYNNASSAQKSAVETNEQRIKNDPAFRQSEITRTQQVIAQLKSQGKDTSAQEKYLTQNLGYQTPAGTVANMNGGANYNTANDATKQALQTNEQRLASDPAFKQSEIQRTLKVIADLKAKGQDYSAQQKYLTVNLGYKEPAPVKTSSSIPVTQPRAPQVSPPVQQPSKPAVTPPPSTTPPPVTTPPPAQTTTTPPATTQQQPAAPAPYQPTYTGPDLDAMRAEIDAMFGNRQDAEMQGLKNALQQALLGYDTQEQTAKQSAYDNRNAADVAAAQNAQQIREAMANAGLTTDGQNLTLQAAQGASRLGALSDINQQEANSLQQIAAQRSQLQNSEAANEQALIKQIGSDKAAALLDLLKYGDQQAFNVDQANYGRYRDNLNQQVAQDQLAWQKQTDLAQLLGTINGQQTLASQAQGWGRQVDLANLLGSINGQQTLAGRAQDWGQQVDIANLLGYLGGQRTLAGESQDWGKQVDLANLLGSIGGQQTLAAQNQAFNQNLATQQQALDQRNSNLNAALQYSGLTGQVLSPQQDWSGLLRQAANGAPQSLAGQAQQTSSDQWQQAFNADQKQRALDNAWAASNATGKVTAELSALTGIPAGTNTFQAQQYWNNYNRGVLESDRNFGLQQDQNDLAWINAANKANGSNEPPATVTGAQAGKLLSQSLSKQVGVGPDNKPVYGTISDPATREQAFISAFNASGVTPGPEVVVMLTQAGYTADEIAKYQAKYPTAFQPAFNGGGAASGSYSTVINSSAAKWGVPAALVGAVIDAESSGNPQAVSGAGAQGLMQLMPDTARGLGVTDPFDPAQNIEGGTQYLRGLLDTYGGDYRKALAGYNAGGSRVQEAIAKYGNDWFAHMPAETQAYVTKIMKGLGGG